MDRFICWPPISSRISYVKVVPANAGTHTARTLVLALERRHFFTFAARGYGSLRSQGRLVVNAGRENSVSQSLRRRMSQASLSVLRTNPRLCYFFLIRRRPPR